MQGDPLGGCNVTPTGYFDMMPPPPLMQGDPLGGCNVTPAGYFDMTRRLAALSPASRIVLALEGGYNTRCGVCAHTLGEEVVCPGA